MKSLFSLSILLFCLSANVFAQSSPAERIFNVRDFGATGDGKTLDTEAINKAIVTCAESGGGRVVVPEGNYLTGTILLKSNITLYLEENATIVGTLDIKQYKGFLDNKDHKIVSKLNLPQNRMGYIWHRALVLLDSVQNVTITGKGTIDGSSSTDPEGEEKIRGPHGILIGQSKNVTITDIRIARAGNYNVMCEYVENVKFSNLSILEGYDGIHVRGGKDMIIEHCKIYSRDDAIAGGYWENMLIKNCLLNSSCNGLRLIMPATNLEMKDCEIWGPGIFGHRRGKPVNPFVTKSLAAFNIQPGAWGATQGTLKDIYIHDIRIRDLNTAFMFNLFEGNTGTSIRVERVRATGIIGTASSVEAWPDGSVYHQITFKDVSIEHIGSTDLANKDIKLRPPGNEARVTPSWGWYIRNVKNIGFENVTMTFIGREVRPMMLVEKTDYINFKNVNYTKVPEIEQIKVIGKTSITGK
ncbi:glycoside hydrolase family 28 protein [Dyadobacter bucti]|uniref:glycoside hydrolase family 28 protein n=1 Tax=Dyadobacter bucti TaxID=2572203 RepID=UPI00140B41ED|nr:glycosyl hydrolase family 28-related protein [Dyadobacter bucti]